MFHGEEKFFGLPGNISLEAWHDGRMEPISTIAAQGAVSALIASGVSTVAWFLFTRTASLRDAEALEQSRKVSQEIQDLERQVNQMRTQELETLGKRITGESERRRAIEERMNRDMVQHRDMIVLREEVSELKALARAQSDLLSRTSAMIELVASHMNIQIGSSKG